MRVLLRSLEALASLNRVLRTQGRCGSTWEVPGRPEDPGMTKLAGRQLFASTIPANPSTALAPRCDHRRKRNYLFRVCYYYQHTAKYTYTRALATYRSTVFLLRYYLIKIATNSTSLDSTKRIFYCSLTKQHVSSSSGVPCLQASTRMLRCGLLLIIVYVEIGMYCVKSYSTGKKNR